MNTDEQWMAYALALGRRNKGNTAENPAVGCVLTQRAGLKTVPVGIGWTQAGGRPHAETQALAMAGERARGATAYVTLEPCNHQGRTPPCSRALIEAGVSRVVVALMDPDVRVAGQGIAALRRAGIAVETGILDHQARLDLAGFLQRKTQGRPHIMLKLAVSGDGKIAAKPGVPTKITGATANARVHLLRASCDAILVGVSTVHADDPQLTCRLAGLEDRSPVRLVSDSKLSIPLDCQLVATARQTPLWVLTCTDADPHKAEALRQAGVTLVYCARTPVGKVDLPEAMLRLGGRGINTVMAEGGAHMARALLEESLVDEVNLFSAEKSLGPEGLDALAGLPLDRITDNPAFRLRSEEPIGEDRLATYERAAKENIMFTGIVTDVGEVIERKDGGSTRLTIACNYDPDTIALGASISCSGTCLTVVEKRRLDDGRGCFDVDVSTETLSKTTIGSWQNGTLVNLERSLKLGDEIGGHMVSGHVDGLAEVIAIEPDGDSSIFKFRAPDDLARFIAAKGSVALDGTSLTVNDVAGSEFTITIIPHTQAVTTWHKTAVGDAINIEIDMLARYVARLSDAHLG